MADEKTTVTLHNVRIDLDYLAELVVDTTGRAGAIDFIIALDEAAADYEFTVTLRDRLNAVIAKVDAAAGGNRTEEFLRWLVRMDNPADEQGCADRQVVTLTQIIGRARDLLGGA